MNKQPVTEDLCESRRETQNEKIDGIKRTIYTSATAMTIVIVIAEFIFTYLHG